MHTPYTNTEEDSLTEAVTKYAERATRSEANMAEMEAKFEERFAMLSMTSQQPKAYTPTPPQYPSPYPMQTAYFTTPPPTFIPPPATIHALSPQQPPPYQQQYNAGKKRCKGQKKGEPGGRRQPPLTT